MTDKLDIMRKWSLREVRVRTFMIVKGKNILDTAEVFTRSKYGIITLKI